MKKIFTVVGIVTIAAGVLLALAMLTQPLAAICCAAGSILSGALFLAVADLLGRVDYLERKLNLYSSDEGNESDLPQKKCPKCGRQIDFDYAICPHCGVNL